MKNGLVNIACVQVGWLACVLGAAWGLPYVGPIVVAGWLLALLVGVPEPGRLGIFLLLAMAVGYLLDVGLVLSGYLAFPSSAHIIEPVPLWMSALWANMAGGLAVSLRILIDKVYLGLPAFGIAAPLAYVAGDSLGALILPGGKVLNLSVIAVSWMAAYLVLHFIHRLVFHDSNNQRLSENGGIAS